MDDPEYDIPKYPKPRQIAAEQAALLGDLSGGRPGAVIETEEQLTIKEQMFIEIDTGIRSYPQEIMKDYGVLIDDEDDEYDITDDPDALDAETLGSWTIQDLKSKFAYEWDPNGNEPDPNIVEMNLPGRQYIAQNPMDMEENVEIGYDPVFGPSNPIDTRTILGAIDSYMIDDSTRDDSMLTPQFHPQDPEIQYNEKVVQFRKSLIDIIETYDDPFLMANGHENLPVPRHVAKWHGYPEPTFLEPQNYTNNRFTNLDVITDFDTMTPYQARRKAIELARSKNAEWLPDGVSQQYHTQQRASYEQYQTLIGTLRPGECDATIVTMIQPVLQILGSGCTLLSIDDQSSSQDGGVIVFRFEYHGLMKNKHGMKCWTEQMIRQDCGLTTASVIFETGFRRRDAAYDGGDKWYGPSN